MSGEPRARCSELEAELHGQWNATDALVDLLACTPIPILLLDRALRIRHYTSTCSDLMGLSPDPRGRTIAEVDWHLHDPGLADAVQRTFADGSSSSSEITVQEKTSYRRQVVPCHRVEGRIEGVVVTFVETVHQTHDERAPPVPKRTLARLIDAAPVRLAHVDENAPRYVHASHIPDLDDEGRVQGFFAVVADLTDRHRAEEEIKRLTRSLRDQLAETQAILAAAPIGIVVAHGQDCQDMTMNPAGAAILRLRPGDTPGATQAHTDELSFRVMKGGRALAPEELAMRYAAIHDRAVEGDELDLVFDDGTSTTVIAHAAPLHDEQGQVRGCVGTFVDVSALRRAETALEDVRRRLGHHMENTPLALVEWDAEMRIRAWNRAAERLFGWREGEVQGKRLDELPFVHANDTGSVERLVHELLSGQAEHNIFINRNYRKDGSVVHCEWHNSVLCDANGRLVSVLSVASDVSERIRLERQLREQADRLAEADRRKDEFLAMLGHELRNPLAPIRNAVEILGLSRGEPQTLDWVMRVVTRQINHMVRLVNDLLDVARITRGTVELDRQTVDIADIVNDAIEANRDILYAKDHRFSLDLPDGSIAVYADPIRMTQVIGNLLNNAAKYTPNGGHITLRARQDQDQLLLEVEDDGIGIDPQDMPWIFDTFSQARRSLDRAQGGLGLGLALARQIVSLHEGTLEAKSDGADHGSLFMLRMPIVQSNASSWTERLCSPQPLTKSTKRVLVVDDQKDVADSLEMLINVLGHSVRCVYDGTGVLDAVREFHPQIVLLDLGLPGMDGYEVATRLGELPERASMKVVAMSGYGQEEFMARARAVGFDDYLLKPGDMERITTLLGRV